MHGHQSYLSCLDDLNSLLVPTDLFVSLISLDASQAFCKLKVSYNEKKKFKLKKLISLFPYAFAAFLLAPSPAYAYAGPAAAIGVVVIAITVVLAFFASTFLKFLALMNGFYRKISKSLSSRKKAKANTKTRK